MTRSPVRTAVASAPGKLILIGEHAVVYGCPALVAAVGLRARVEASSGGLEGVTIELPDLDLHQSAGWAELEAYAARARAAWERYAEAPSPSSFRRVRGVDRAHLVKVALGELAAELTAAEAGVLPPLALRIESEIPIGSGLGSSAALAVGILAAAAAALGREVSTVELDRLALEVERRQHGMPSGADHATVLAGGILRVERGERGLTTVEMPVRGELLARLKVYDTGPPAESTGEVVAAVRALRDRDPAAFEARLVRMTAAVEQLAAALASPDEAAVERCAAAIASYERCLEELGVVPDSVRRCIRRIEERGAVAKISGAGALSEGGAGSLLVFRPPAAAGLAHELCGLASHAVDLGAPGLIVEARE